MKISFGRGRNNMKCEVCGKEEIEVTICIERGDNLDTVSLCEDCGKKYKITAIKPSMYGEFCYNAYCDSVGWKSFNGSDLPKFNEQSDKLKQAWQKAAIETIHFFVTKFLKT